MPDKGASNRVFSRLPLQGGKFQRYALALLAVALAVGLRASLQPLLGESMRYISISVATVFAAWYCGMWPAILSAIVGFFGANLLFASPHQFLGSLNERGLVGNLFVLASSGAIIALGEVGRRAVLRLGRVHDTLQRSREQLKFRVRERTAQLRQSNQNLRDLSARLLRVQDDERRRIARDLHDSTGQSLTALKLDLAGIERELASRNPQLAQRLAASIADARQISDELRTISYLLHPPLLDELGLDSALRWYADGFQKRSGISVRLDFGYQGRLASEMEMTLFRVVQECLINVHRHSGSSTASIRISQAPDQIVLEVEDEGTGIPPQELSEINSGVGLGVGMRGMRERIRDLGGEFEIFSSERGARVRAAIPTAIGPPRNIPAPAATGAPGDESVSSDALARRAGLN